MGGCGSGQHFRSPYYRCTTKDCLEIQLGYLDIRKAVNEPDYDKYYSLIEFYKTDQFVWLLKWSHIHLFGMNMIFIFIGTITIFLSINDRIRTWLVILPFIGVLVDITAMWLKAYVSPVFFWLHLPGGGMFGGIFLFVAFRALCEMWR